MNERQKLFVKHYLVDPNATKASISAGYPESGAAVQGSRLLKNAKIREEIAKGQARLVKKLDISAEYVLGTVHETVERCRQARPVLNKKGHPVMIETPAGELAAAYVFNSRDVLKGCEMLGKHLGIFGEEDRARSTTIPVQIVTNIVLPNANV